MKGNKKNREESRKSRKIEKNREKSRKIGKNGEKRKEEEKDLFEGDAVASGRDDEVVASDVLGAVVAGGVGPAQALEAADDVDARAAVVARVRLALVQVHGAQLSREAPTLSPPHPPHPPHPPQTTTTTTTKTFPPVRQR